MRGSGTGAAARAVRAMAAATACLGLAAVTAGLALATWRIAGATDWRVWEAADAIAVSAGLLSTLAAARFALEVVAALGARLRGAAAPRWTGRLARSAAAGLAAAALGAGAAHAAEEPPSAGWLPAGEAAASPWTPATETPAPARTTGRGAAPVAPGDPPRIRVVEPGDSLWAIAAAELGDDATVARVAAAWPALYAANRDVIGVDPDLIHPGQRLTVPASLDGDAR